MDEGEAVENLEEKEERGGGDAAQVVKRICTADAC